MDEAIAWCMDQEEESRRDFFDFLEEQQQIWTPRSLFRRCCVKWIADGKRTHGYDDFGDAFFDPNFRRGCEGSDECGREHPAVTLTYEDGSGAVTMATLSHALDPFVEYFERRARQGTAELVTEGTRDCTYRLTGYLRENYNAMIAGPSAPDFGKHLIQTTSLSMNRSDRAQNLEMEELERAKKRIRVTGPPLQPELVETTLEICRKHRLESDLDSVDIANLRLATKATGLIAARMAKNRMKLVQLSCLPMVDGKVKVNSYSDHLDSHLVEFDQYQPHDEEDQCGREGIHETIYKPASSCRLFLVPKACDGQSQTSAGSPKTNCNGSTDIFELQDGQRGHECSWDSGILDDDDEPDRYEASEGIIDYLFDYVGHRVKVFLEPLQTREAPVDVSVARLPSSNDAETEKNADNLILRHVHELDTFYLKPPFKASRKIIQLKSRWGGLMECEILENEVIRSCRSAQLRSDDDGDNDNEGEDDGEETIEQVHYKGSFRILKIRYHFADLLAKVARLKAKQAEKSFKEVKKWRPLNSTEKAQKKAIANAIALAGGDRRSREWFR